MSELTSYKCASGCTFVKPVDDPMICKCAAEACGRRPPSSAQEFHIDTMASEFARMDGGLMDIAMRRLNERVGIRVEA